MRRRTIGIAGIVLVVVSVTGVAVAATVLSTFRSSTGNAPYPMMRPYGVPPSAAPSSGPYGGYSTPGQRIFFTGAGSSGPIPRRGGLGMMAAAGCANCHGTDGRGGRIAGMMGGGIHVPDIRYSTLTSPKTDQGKSEPGWTDAQIAAAIRDGADPAGGRLSGNMPRWQMDDKDVTDLISFLKELK